MQTGFVEQDNHQLIFPGANGERDGRRDKVEDRNDDRWEDKADVN